MTKEIEDLSIDEHKLLTTLLNKFWNSLKSHLEKNKDFILADEDSKEEMMRECRIEMLFDELSNRIR